MSRPSFGVPLCRRSDTMTAGLDRSLYNLVRPLRHLILIVSLAGFAATNCSAAVITAIGENASNADQWRTQTTKTINPAGNNIYGNDGYVMFTTSAVGAGSGRLSVIFHCDLGGLGDWSNESHAIKLQQYHRFSAGKLRGLRRQTCRCVGHFFSWASWGSGCQSGPRKAVNAGKGRSNSDRIPW